MFWHNSHNSRQSFVYSAGIGYLGAMSLGFALSDLMSILARLYIIRSARYTAQEAQYKQHTRRSARYFIHIHTKQYTAHSTPYATHHTQDTTHRTEYKTHNTQHTIHRIGYTTPKSKYSIKSAHHTMQTQTTSCTSNTEYTIHTTQYTLHNTQSTVHETPEATGSWQPSGSRKILFSTFWT